MKKMYIAILVVIVVSILTVSVFAADPIQAINNADIKLRDGASKLVGLAGVGGAFAVFYYTKKMIGAVGTLAGGALIAYLISNPSIIAGLVEGVATWANSAG